MTDKQRAYHQKRIAYKEERLAKAERLYGKGFSIKEIGSLLNMSTKTISPHLKSKGLRKKNMFNRY